MFDAFGIEAGAGPLRDDIYEVILKIFSNARNKCYPDRCCQQPADAAYELRRCVFIESCCVSVNDVAENQRVEKRKYLVYGGKQERNQHQPPVFLQVSEKQGHRA